MASPKVDDELLAAFKSAPRPGAVLRCVVADAFAENPAGLAALNEAIRLGVKEPSLRRVMGEKGYHVPAKDSMRKHMDGRCVCHRK